MFAKNVASLIKVKSIITFAVLIVFDYLAFKGLIPPGDVLQVVLIVIGFYFGSQSEKKSEV